MPDLDRVMHFDTLPDHALLTREEVGRLTGYAKVTLKVWAEQGKGPKITRVESTPRYMVRHIREWLNRGSENANA